MFTGIIETIGKVVEVKSHDANLQITVAASLSKELKPDQSVSHNGVCLTVVRADTSSHSVVAVKETLQRTTLGALLPGSYLNLERAMSATGRFDGHLVQGHVDQTGTCLRVENENGSKKFWFSFNPANRFLLVEKGSVCIDGVSLTVVDAEPDNFSVVIIPFTQKHTCFQYLKPGNSVNLEYDILGKYVQKNLQAFNFGRQPAYAK